MELEKELEKTQAAALPRQIAQAPESDALLLLLDGLDKVRSNARFTCIATINAFRKEHLMPIVVCSRIADYESLTNKLRLEGAVLRTNQARRILFVADRDALVEQARLEGFQDHIPDEPCTRIYTHKIDQTNRPYVVTLQTLSKCFEQFTPAFFDLIIFDEVHRSIFDKWNEVLQYFDGRLIGLTATPADFIERNTFLEFDCHDETPTFLYEYGSAIDDGYLVDYSLYAARTRFQRAVQNVFLQRRRLVWANLYEPPLTSFGQDAVERWFTTDQVSEMLTFVDTLTGVSRLGSA